MVLVMSERAAARSPNCISPNSKVLACQRVPVQELLKLVSRIGRALQSGLLDRRRKLKSRDHVALLSGAHPIDCVEGEVSPMNLGSVIRKRRAELGLRQKAVAEEIGVSEDYLSLIERDQRTPSLEMLEKLAAALSVPVSYLLFEAEPINPNLSEETRKIVEDARKVAAELLRRITELQQLETES